MVEIQLSLTSVYIVSHIYGKKRDYRRQLLLMYTYKT